MVAFIYPSVPQSIKKLHVLKANCRKISSQEISKLESG